MNVISEKRYREIPVTDLDIYFYTGLHDVLMLRDDVDSFEETPEALLVQTVDPKTLQPLERIVYLKRNMASYKVRHRLYKIEDKRPLPTIEAGEPTDG